jgi:hypothetical protein
MAARGGPADLLAGDDVAPAPDKDAALPQVPVDREAAAAVVDDDVVVELRDRVAVLAVVEPVVPQTETLPPPE